MKTDNTWSEEDEKLLIEQHAAGASAGDIARMFTAMGRLRTRNSVIGKWTRMGLPRRKAVRLKPVTAPLAGYVRKAPRAERRSALTGLVRAVKPTAKAWANNAHGAASDPLAWTRFFDAGRNQCKWIVDERVSILDRMVCGLPVIEGKSWCAGCARVVFSAEVTTSERNAIRDALRAAA